MKLKRLRTKVLKLTLLELSQKLGCTEGQVHHIEGGRRRLTYKNAMKLQRLSRTAGKDVPVDALMRSNDGYIK